MRDQRFRSLAATLLVCFIWGLLLPIAVFADTAESESTAASPPTPIRAYGTPLITHPSDGATVSGKVEVRITANAPSDSNVVLLLDGRLRAISNVPPFTFELDTDNMTEGLHTLQAQVYVPNGDTTNSAISTIQVGNPPVFMTNPFPQPTERPVVSKIGSPASAALPTRTEELPFTAQADLVRPSEEAVSLVQPTRIARAPSPPTRITHEVKRTQSPRTWKMNLTTGPLRKSSTAVTPLQTVHKATPSVSQAQQYCRLPNSIQQSLVQGGRPRVANQAVSLTSPTVSGTKPAATASSSVDTIIEQPQPAAAAEPTEQQQVRSHEMRVHHEVGKGDCLSSIARRYGTSVTAISEANAIGDVHKIRISDQLWIPSNPTLCVDGNPLQTQPGPFFHQGKLMVPLRATVEACGGKVHWDAATRQVRFTVSGSTVIVGVGESQALRDNRVLTLEGQVVIREDRSFVPLESLREMAALPIRYEPEQNRIEIARLPQ